MGAPQAALPTGTYERGIQSDEQKWQPVYDQIAVMQQQQQAQMQAAQEAAAEEERRKALAQQQAAQDFAAMQAAQQNQVFSANLATLQAPPAQQVPTPDYANKRAGGGFFGAPAMLGQWNDNQFGNPRNTFLGA